MSIIELPSGASIWYQRQGSGAPLLQIHGSAFGHRNFEKMTPLMTAHAEVIDFDLPGYGESFGPPLAAGMPPIADLIFEFIQALRIGRLDIHGTSFGAMLGLTLAARHPEVVDRLVLSCFLARYDHAARMMRSTWKRAARDSGMQAVADLTSVAGFARGFYDLPDAQAQLASMRDAFSRTTADAFIAGTETIERTDLTPLLADVKNATLLLAGAEDNMTPFALAPSGVGMSRIKDMLPHCELAVLPECGHYLVLEQPSAAAKLIGEFLARRS
jgi:3-oxoadipate enol-lactonase